MPRADGSLTAIDLAVAWRMAKTLELDQDLAAPKSVGRGVYKRTSGHGAARDSVQSLPVVRKDATDGIFHAAV